MNILQGFLRPVWVQISILFMAALAGAGCAWLIYDVSHLRANRTAMQEIAQVAVDRAELTTDYAVITLGEVASRGLYACTEGNLDQMRRSIYLRGPLKDIQIYGANDKLRCAGLTQMESLGITQFVSEDGIVAHNSNKYLHHAGTETGGLLGVSWRLGGNLTLYAILNVDGLMFDLFPADLRDKGYADLLLGNKPLAQYSPRRRGDAFSDDYAVFDAYSGRYPLEMRMAVHKNVLAAWNRDMEFMYVGLGGLVGAVLGGFMIVLLARPRDIKGIMQDALQAGEFKPYVQPIFSLEDRRIVGCEALARWVKPDGSVVQPNVFVPLAEDNGLIIPMTRALIGAGLVQMSRLLTANRSFKIAFNIVPADLVSKGFAKDISDLAKAAGVARSQIVLEITERQSFGDSAAAVEAIRRLQEMGFRVALDDTGTGHNGLSMVQELRADIIKIDKHFVDAVGVDQAATKIVEMLVALAQGLGMTTVAEGVETEQQVEALQACGVDEGQGYLVSPPVPVVQFIEDFEVHSRKYKLSKRAAA